MHVCALSWSGRGRGPKLRSRKVTSHFMFLFSLGGGRVFILQCGHKIVITVFWIVGVGKLKACRLTAIKLRDCERTTNLGVLSRSQVSGCVVDAGVVSSTIAIINGILLLFIGLLLCSLSL